MTEFPQGMLPKVIIALQVIMTICTVLLNKSTNAQNLKKKEKKKRNVVA